MLGANSDFLSEEDEQNREGKSCKADGRNENEHILYAHTIDPRLNWESGTRCEEVTQEDHGDKSVIEDLIMLVLVAAKYSGPELTKG